MIAFGTLNELNDRGFSIDDILKMDRETTVFSEPLIDDLASKKDSSDSRPSQPRPFPETRVSCYLNGLYF